MKFYFSYWSKPTQSASNINVTKKFMARSLLELKKNYKDIHLITDYEGEKEFKNFGWNSISTALEEIDKKYKEVWSLGKIKSYIEIAKKGDPFFHIDHDFLITKKLDDKILNADIVVEGEENIYHYYYNIDYFDRTCRSKYFAECNYVDKAYTCGIFGGKDLIFIYDYASSSYKMATDKINENYFLASDDIHKRICPHYKSFNKATIPEQYYLAASLKKWNKVPLIFWKSTCQDLLDTINPNYDPNYFDFYRRTGCIHFFGIHKGLLDRYDTALKNINDLNLKKL